MCLASHTKSKTGLLNWLYIVMTVGINYSNIEIDFFSTCRLKICNGCLYAKQKENYLKIKNRFNRVPFFDIVLPV